MDGINLSFTNLDGFHKAPLSSSYYWDPIQRSILQWNSAHESYFLGHYWWNLIPKCLVYLFRRTYTRWSNEVGLFVVKIRALKYLNLVSFQEQKWVVAVLLMVPIYATESVKYPSSQNYVLISLVACIYISQVNWLSQVHWLIYPHLIHKLWYTLDTQTLNVSYATSL